MSGYFTFMRKVSWLLCMFFFFSGCGKEEPPPKPKVITKKIIMEKKAASPTADAKTGKEPAIPDKAKSDKKEQPPLAAVQKTEPSEIKAEAAPKTPEPQTPATAEKPVKPPDKPIDKPSEKTVAKTVPGSPKPLEKKADIIVPDISALEKEVQKAMAVYDPKGRTDPFAPLFKDEPKPKPGHVKSGEGKPGRILTPLEKLDLSQLKLVGIVRGIGGPRALVEETGGKGYIIKKGTYIGIHSGKVADIFDDKIVIDEEFEDYTGNEIDGWERHVTVRKREMKLQKSPGDEL